MMLSSSTRFPILCFKQKPNPNINPLSPAFPFFTIYINAVNDKIQPDQLGIRIENEVKKALDLLLKQLSVTL